MPTKCPEKLRKKEKRKYKRLRKRVLEFLGPKCRHCGIEDMDVLQIDHIEPILTSKRLGSKTWFFHVLNGNYPTENLQILCANCHMKKTVNERE